MDVVDPRIGLLAAGVAAVGSERTRKAMGRGVGYAAAAAIKVGGPVARAGRDIYQEARDVAVSNGGSKSRSRRS